MLQALWLLANISPIFKKGERYLPANYRPVSLTCISSKLLEHIVVKHILNHFDYNNILVDCQHGFRSRRSCETQLVTFVQELSQSMHGGTRTDVAIMDFSKAFDKVPHQRLLLKLNHYGVRGATLGWIEGFLSNRKQRVLVDGVTSPWASVHSGVPQGTVLGPLLFLAYINDLPNYTESPIRLFADDCLLYRHKPRIPGPGQTHTEVCLCSMGSVPDEPHFPVRTSPEESCPLCLQQVP